ncbi:MAG TPA: hypothetical protein VGB76_17120 [Pyrinomonadaceae bacterium]
MTNLRIRAFLPVIFLQLIFALTNTPHAFSQATQTAPPPAQAVATTGEKATAGDEACEQSSVVNGDAAKRPGVELLDARKRTSFTSQHASLISSPRELKTGAARSFAFDANARSSSDSFANQTNPGGQAATATYTPLTSNQKMRRAFRSAFLTPQAYALPFASAVLTEWGEEDLPHKDTDDRVADGLSRFAIKFGRRSTTVLLSNGVYASLFKQDPRYERADRTRGVAARALHAASRVFITRGDNGRHQPNYSRFAGQLSGSALSNLWEQSTPGRDRIGTDATFRRFGMSFVTGALSNVIREFLPGILGR